MKNERHTFDLLEEPKDELYRQLISFAASCSSLGMLVVRADLGLSISGEKVLADLGPYMVEKTRSSKWPGTELLMDEADIVYFRLLSGSVNILQSAAKQLYAWCQPELPEDLCFLSEDRESWLITITHERDGYLRLNEWERQRLAEALPDLKLALSTEEAL